MTQPLDCAIVLTTIGADADAEALARTLVEEKLAACVNLSAEMVSIYRWNDALQRDREQQMVIKTTVGRVDALRTRLHELHPYDVPEFLVVAVTNGSEDYLRWVRDMTEAI